MSLDYLVKYLCLKIRHAQNVIDANRHVKLIATQKAVLKYFSGKISII